MPGQRQKGKNNRRKIPVRREFVEPEGSHQIIGFIENTHGGYPPRFSVRTPKDELIVAPIQGSIAKGPKRITVRKGDVVMLEELSCSTINKEATSVVEKEWYIHHVYTKDDVKSLEIKGYLDSVERVAGEETSKLHIGKDLSKEKEEIEINDCDIDNL